MQGDAFSALRRAVAGINVLSTLSPVQMSGRGVGRGWGLSDCFSLSLAWLWRQGHPVKGGRWKVGQGMEGKGRKRPAWDWQPSCHTRHCDVYVKVFIFDFVVIDRGVETESETFVTERDLIPAICLYTPHLLICHSNSSERIKLYFLLCWGRVFLLYVLIKWHYTV